MSTSHRVLHFQARMLALAPSPTRYPLNSPIGLHKYSEKVYEACIESFTALPLSGLLDGKFFCVHGGISPELNTVSDIDRVCTNSEQRCSTRPDFLLVRLTGSKNLAHSVYYATCCGLTQSQTLDTRASLLSTRPRYRLAKCGGTTPHGAALITTRQALIPSRQSSLTVSYRYEAVIKFLERNELLGVIRGHEAQDAGWVNFPNSVSRAERIAAMLCSVRPRQRSSPP